jgi:Zn-finger nucleic acid-binding protein
MQCPIDGTALVMSERQGIEIDYCPQCRGVWLDRGELDKILERAAGQVPPPRPGFEQAPPEQRHDDRRREDPRHDPRYQERPHKKRRDSFLDDLFDFG